jgi:hypothetical protein
MRRLVMIGVLLLAGCQTIEGPRARRADPQRVDDPRLTISEQERRARERLALPDDSPNFGPRTYFDPPEGRLFQR